MKRLLWIMMAAIAFTAVADEYLDLVGRADDAIAEGRWETADSLLTAAIQLDPANTGNIMLLSNLGMLRYYRGDDSAAIATLTQAHTIALRSTAILINRATVYTAKGRLAEAMADYDTVLMLDPSLAAPRFSRGMLALKTGNIPLAESDMLTLDSIAPGSREAETGMAAVLTATGHFAEAAIRYTHVLDKDKQPEFYAARALCYLMTERLGDASEDIASGLMLDPADGELYLYRAVLNKMRYRPDDARADAARAVELGVEPRRATALLGDASTHSRHKK